VVHHDVLEVQISVEDILVTKVPQGEQHRGCVMFDLSKGRLGSRRFMLKVL
jgi:hypothetical protein